MPRFHESRAAGLGESGLAAVGLAVDQFEQVLAEDVIAKQIGQPGDGLLDARHPDR